VLIGFPFNYYFLLAAVILTVISAIDYLAKLWPYLLEDKKIR
ncbi:CDP-diacylglycerol--glycerol-3-phosphate 3-phosphatidyltransferase, partial [Candidatus Woesearchaeota archaeon]|nr:CDP-diacylglycerol--glycerol-3-phosphate 3-phosphatidyltransferase [Candidatus Woesearchaeota archaeon]